MPQIAQAAAPRQAELSLSRREQGRKLRTAFLRRFRACGEVKKAAEQAGIAHATLYRWRTRDEDFRERWDSVADQRRFALEDRLMQLVQDGEKSAVFHKGEQVGWRVSHTSRPVLAMLAYLDRREKLRIEEEKRALESHYSGFGGDRNAHSAGFDDDDDCDDDYDDDEVDNDGVGEEEDDNDDVDEVEEEGDDDVDEDDMEEDDAEEEEAATVAPVSVRPGVPAAPVETPKKSIMVRIVHVPWFDNKRLHLPGAVAEISDMRHFSTTCMELLEPGAQGR